MTGSNGIVGQDLLAHVKKHHQAVPLTRQDADITDTSLLVRAFEKSSAAVVIHTAAFTAVRECGRKPDLAFRVNSEGTRNIALPCRRTSRNDPSADGDGLLSILLERSRNGEIHPA